MASISGAECCTIISVKISSHHTPPSNVERQSEKTKMKARMMPASALQPATFCSPGAPEHLFGKGAEAAEVNGSEVTAMA